MANEMIIELMLLIPMLTLALIPIIFYIMYLCQERIKRISICNLYTEQVFSSSMIGQDGLIRPSVEYKKVGPIAEVSNDIYSLSLNVPFLDPAVPAYKPTEMVVKVWKNNSDPVHLYRYTTFGMVDETHI